MITDTLRRTALSLPVTIQFGRLVLAAGATGRPLALVFRNYPASLLGELWRYFAEEVGAEQVLDLQHPGSRKKLSTGWSKYRLVLAYDSSRYEEAAWMISSVPNQSEETDNARPSIFTRFGSGEPDDDPGASLVIHGNQDEIEAVAAFLHRTQGKCVLGKKIATPTAVEIDRKLEELILNRVRRHRDRQVICGLLAGSRLLAEDNAREGKQVRLVDYQEVHGLIRKPLVRPSDDPFDPLALAMVARANVYLSFESRPAETKIKFARIHQESSKLEGATAGSPRHITRRDLLNLGDVQGKTILELIKRLLADPDGFTLFRTLGLKQPMHHEKWASTNAVELTRILLQWTYKQVRDHFDKLRRAGMITARRERNNGPWIYDIPETLTSPRSGFECLPNPAEIEAKLTH